MAKNNFEPRNKFERWVRAQGGTKQLALILGVSQTGVQHWLAGRARPSAKVAYDILKLSRGLLKISDILKAGE